MTTDTHPHFVPNGDSQRDTAILLVGTADEFGIDQRAIKSSREGFYITTELADVLGESPEEVLADPSEDPATPAEAPADADPEADAQDSEPEDDEDDEGFDPADHDIDGVKAFVTENPETATAVLGLEQDGKNRKTLTAWLIERAENQTSGDLPEDDQIDTEE